MDDFDSQDVIDLVESALRENNDVFVPQNVVPLGLGQGDLLERLYRKLEGSLDHATLQMVYDDIRSELYEGIRLPPLKEVHQTTLYCRKCKDAVKEDPQIPKWNLVDPDCVFILDNPLSSEEAIQYFLACLSGAGFSSKRVCLTYVNRCPSLNKLGPEQIKNCTPYLYTEIQILKPKVIVPLGLLPSSVFMGSDLTLGTIRGRKIWIGPWVFMPTYSPQYALHSGGAQDSGFKSDLTSIYNFCYGE